MDKKEGGMKNDRERSKRKKKKMGEMEVFLNTLE